MLQNMTNTFQPISCISVQLEKRIFSKVSLNVKFLPIRHKFFPPILLEPGSCFGTTPFLNSVRLMAINTLQALKVLFASG